MIEIFNSWILSNSKNYQGWKQLDYLSHYCDKGILLEEDAIRFGKLVMDNPEKNVFQEQDLLRLLVSGMKREGYNDLYFSCEFVQRDLFLRYWNENKNPLIECINCREFFPKSTMNYCGFDEENGEIGEYWKCDSCASEDEDYHQ